MSLCKLEAHTLYITEDNLSLLVENNIKGVNRIEISIASNLDFLSLLPELNKIKILKKTKIILIDKTTLIEWLAEDTRKAWERLPSEYKC